MEDLLALCFTASILTRHGGERENYMSDFISKKTEDLYREHSLHDEYEPMCSDCYEEKKRKEKEFVEKRYKRLQAEGNNKTLSDLEKLDKGRTGLNEGY